jgi:hypothetical protein
MLSPSEPKGSSFNQSMETVGKNNEQADVRQLWELGKATQINNITANHAYGTNSSNSDSSQIIPVTITSIINDIYPSPTDKVMTVSPHVNDLERIEHSKKILNNNGPNEITTTKESDTFVTIDRVITDSPSTENSMLTSTELITEVSVYISDNINKNSLYYTDEPSLSSKSKLNFNISEVLNMSQITTTSLQNTTDKIPFLPTASFDNIDPTVNKTEKSSATIITELLIPQVQNKQKEVNNFLLDIILSTNHSEVTEPTFLDMQINQKPIKTSKIEILSQVKAIPDNDINNNSNVITKNNIKSLDELAIPSNTTLELSSLETVNDTNITPKFQQTNNSLSNISITIETTSEINISKFLKSLNKTEAKINSPIISSILHGEESQIVTTSQPEEIQNSIHNINVIDANKTLNTWNKQKQFNHVMNITNTTSPTGTEILIKSKKLLRDNNTKLNHEMITHPKINLNENITSNNFFYNNLMAKLINSTEKPSVDSRNNIESTFIINEYFVDSSADGFPQLLRVYSDHTNKTLPVINSSAIEINNGNFVVTETTTLLSTTLLPDTNLINTNTESITSISSSIKQISNETLETTTFYPITFAPTSDNPNSNLINLTSVNAPYSTRMSQAFDAFLNTMTQPEVSVDYQVQKLDSLTTNSTELLPIVEDLTKIAFMDDSTNLEPTNISVETETTIDFTTVSPTLFTRLQDSTPAITQRKENTNITSNRIYPALSSTIKYPSLSVFLSNFFNMNKQSNINSTIVVKSTISPNNLSNERSTTISPTTKSSTSILSTKKSSTSQSFIRDPYIGLLNTNKPTPRSKFSSSSSTTAPFRDYLIYGIYPNKTIVRKRPEDNLIDPRNIDSPYVIFGLYPDGKLVRKYPNGTVIPDPPSNPVEIVFSLDTTTTTLLLLMDPDYLIARLIFRVYVTGISKYLTNLILLAM